MFALAFSQRQFFSRIELPTSRISVSDKLVIFFARHPSHDHEGILRRAKTLDNFQFLQSIMQDRAPNEQARSPLIGEPVQLGMDFLQFLWKSRRGGSRLRQALL